MKALTVKQPWASLIAGGKKTLEVRTWQTSHRGPLLICSSKKPILGLLPVGVSVCIVEVVGCRPMTVEDEAAACFACFDGAFVWELNNVQPVEHKKIQGKLSIFEVNF